MADIDENTILRVGTEEAVRNVQDLKNNIKELKNQLVGLDIGSEEYNKTLQELNVNQNALKDAMHYTTSESKSAEQAMNGIATAASGLGNSYNALVARLKTLKEEWRATEDVAKRKELTKQVRAVNDELMELDASVGTWKRNVGNYASALSGLEGGMKSLAGSALNAVKSVTTFSQGVKVMGQVFKVAVPVLLIGAIVTLTKKLKENEVIVNAVKKAMEALKPVTDFLAAVFEKIVGVVATLITKFATFASKSIETFGKIVAGAVGVGNAILQFILAPIKTVIEASKSLGKIMHDVFTGNFRKIKEDAKNAWDGIKDAFTGGFDFRKNFDAGKQVGEQFVKGLAAMKPSAKRVAEETGTEIGAAAGEKAVNAFQMEVEKAFKRGSALREGWAKEAEEIDKEIADESKALAAEIDAMWDAQVDADLRAKAEAEKMQKAREDAMKNAAKTTVASISSILGSVADIYESVSANDEKAAKETKGIRIAASVIDTLSGAIAAYMSAQGLPAPFGQIIGAVNAGTVLAAGAANIAKIQNTDISKSAGSSAASLSSFSAPTVTTSIPQTTILRGASDDMIMNQIGQPSRVYILQSDIEAAGKSSKARVSESAFA